MNIQNTPPAAFTIAKTVPDQMLVFGWGNVAADADGARIEDLQGDVIPTEELEKAAYDHVLRFRSTGEKHDPALRHKGRLVESCVFTREKQAAMGIPPGILPEGWWVGYKIDDPAAWAKIKSGEYQSFSVGGKGVRTPVEKARHTARGYAELRKAAAEKSPAPLTARQPRRYNGPVAKTYAQMRKFNPYHDAQGRFSSANGAASFTVHTRDPKKQHLADAAVQREKTRLQGLGGEHQPSKADALRINALKTEINDLQEQIEAKKRMLNEISDPIERARAERAIRGLERKQNAAQNRLEVVEKFPDHSEPFLDIAQVLESQNVQANGVHKHAEPLRDDQIVNRISGGDMTEGSCSSLALAYIGNKAGLDVLDFRDGKSRETFSRRDIIEKFLQLDGVRGKAISVTRETSEAAEILKGIDVGKEFYFAAGKHAAIVRNTERGPEYLELQSGIQNGWMPFNGKYGTIKRTLKERFGCTSRPYTVKFGDRKLAIETKVFLMEVDSFKKNNEFAELLAYINTSPEKQRKGAAGHVK